MVTLPNGTHKQSNTLLNSSEGVNYQSLPECINLYTWLLQVGMAKEQRLAEKIRFLAVCKPERGWPERQEGMAQWIIGNALL